MESSLSLTRHGIILSLSPACEELLIVMLWFLHLCSPYVLYITLGVSTLREAIVERASWQSSPVNIKHRRNYPASISYIHNIAIIQVHVVCVT